MELSVQEKYLIFDLTKLTTKDGKPYLRMVLSDNNAKLMNAIMFDVKKLNFEPKKGDMVSVSGTLQSYNDQTQLKVNDMSFERDGGSEAFLPKSAHSPEKMAEELQEIFKKNLKNEWLIKLVILFFNDTDVWSRFQKMPAAKSMHHAYLHGLLEHTLGACRLGVEVCKLYPHLFKCLVLTGLLFHDVGKVDELDISASFDYSQEGKLLGHLMIGYTMVSNYIAQIDGFPNDLKEELLHIMISHHGALEFGSPQVPKTLEALIVNFVDDMDAKLNAIESVFQREDVAVGGWSNYDRLLERQLFRVR